MDRKVNPRKQITAPTSLHELRLKLCEMYADVSNDKAMVPQADAAANVAGKIINITKLELDAAKLTGRAIADAPAAFLAGANDKAQILSEAK